MISYHTAIKQIKWKTKALRQLRKIKNRQGQQKIHKEIGTLVKFPHCENVKKIKTTEMHRLRIGRWRVIFTDSLEIITIKEVKPRNERTYK
ncbi:MAG: type II toxin-antitoxin system RelE/ParE family toxin [Desulfocapsa sp.]|nr:type II toxin-antitoxin system RelE/ParE family toxin [Desulfocapsa sp.]